MEENVKSIILAFIENDAFHFDSPGKFFFGAEFQTTLKSVLYSAQV
jgi:hypothetical protein